ncbi:hypothetical protein PPYR_00320 [Photinus pyralis]|uniref:DNA polymerase epsilon subunit n=1 Tax=Photinus pyralis TaxID=7054 RepID=A0A5N4B1T1_PHOPY|nr:DNA polymerase epsilon subunit 2 [Photinus pyralis]KAB0803350.1 hypothetical protein PPYR_00320 [Photinus pyralis]
MPNIEKLNKKLYNTLKLSGFLVRREFCTYVIEKLLQENIQLDENATFDKYVKTLCSNLEKQCLINKSIEKHHIECVVEIALNSGYDKQETIFSTIGAFEFPKLRYDSDRRIYLPAISKSRLLSGPNSKTQLFLDRYNTVLQRTQRNFKNKITKKESDRLFLQTVDYLFTKGSVTLNKTLILGALFQMSEGKFALEDPSGLVELDFSDAKYHGGFFVENSFVLVNGYYEDKLIKVSTVISPPGEEYKDSILSFGSINYYGGPSITPLRNSQNLAEQLRLNPNNSIMLFSDVWLDHPMIFEKLEILFNGFHHSPPIAFIFMGNFMQDYQGLEKIDNYKKLFKKFGELLSNYTELVHKSKFVFVPSMTDPCHLHILPRFPLPSHVTEEFQKSVPSAIFTTNPCRLQYYTKEIVLFRADILPKLMQGALEKPQIEEIPEFITRTIIGQGHLCPFSLNAVTVNWDFDYTLRLFPLPNLIVLGDKSEAYQGKYKECQLVNPGSFCGDEEFQFMSYVPFDETIQECSL